MTDPTPAVAGSGAVAGRAGMPRWLLMYRIERGELPGPSFSAAGRRLYTEADIRDILAVLDGRPELRSSRRRRGARGPVTPRDATAIDGSAGPGGTRVPPRPPGSGFDPLPHP